MNTKQVTTFLLFIFIIFSCRKNDDGLRENPHIPNIAFEYTINTNLANYSSLTSVGNHEIIQDNGINGIVVINEGFSNYSAFELTDPGHQLNTCSNLTVEGIIATCNCTDANKFNILSGGAPMEGTTSAYPLKRYFVEVSGNIIRVFNN